MRKQKIVVATIAILAVVGLYAAGQVYIRHAQTFIGPLTFGISGKPFVDNPALILGGGTNAAPLLTSEADHNFIDFRGKTTAASGTNRMLYLKTYFDMTTPSGETGRFYSVVDTAGANDVHGIHSSVAFGTNGTVTGEVAAVRGTLEVPNKTLGGTDGAAFYELNAAGTSTNASNIQFARYVLSGNATGAGNLDGSAALFSIEGSTIGSGKIVQTSTATAAYAIRIRLPNGAYAYLLAASAP